MLKQKLTTAQLLATLRYARMKREWVEVESSWISHARYDLATHTLIVQFKDTGKWWQYHRVQPSVARAFIDSPSKGQFIHRNLNRRPNGPFDPTEVLP